MVRRYGSPYDHKRYLVNKNPSSKEIHDLDNETEHCHIDDIKIEHIEMLDTESDVKQYLRLNPDFDGCFWCLRKYHSK